MTRPERISKGVCQCGCGQQAPIAQKTDKKRGWVKGQPLKYIQGHNAKLKLHGRIEFVIDTVTGCWIWQRSKTAQGYGNITVNNKQVLAHRFLYEQYKGVVPEGMELDHLCKNKFCINPDHLQPVTHAENCRRGPKSKLDWQDVRKIKTMLAAGATHREIAEQFNVTHTTIGSIARGKAWTDNGVVKYG